MDKIAWVAFLCQQFHQSMFAIPGIQFEGQPDEQATGYDSEGDTYPLVYANDEQYNEQQEYHNKSSGKDEEVL